MLESIMCSNISCLWAHVVPKVTHAIMASRSGLPWAGREHTLFASPSRCHSSFSLFWTSLFEVTSPICRLCSLNVIGLKDVFICPVSGRLFKFFHCEDALLDGNLFVAFDSPPQVPWRWSIKSLCMDKCSAIDARSQGRHSVRSMDIADRIEKLCYKCCQLTDSCTLTLSNVVVALKSYLFSIYKSDWRALLPLTRLELLCFSQDTKSIMSAFSGKVALASRIFTTYLAHNISGRSDYYGASRP